MILSKEDFYLANSMCKVFRVEHQKTSVPVHFLSISSITCMLGKSLKSKDIWPIMLQALNLDAITTGHIDMYHPPSFWDFSL